MLDRQDESSPSPLEIDRDQLYIAIKQAYVDLDRDLRSMVEDDSGSVCVSSTDDSVCKLFLNTFR
mgnify:CR=1 FL=1